MRDGAHAASEKEHKLIRLVMERCYLRFPQVNLDSVAGPGGNSCAKEVLILSPDRSLEHQCSRNHGPIVRVPESDARSSNLFVPFIKASIDGFHDERNLVEQIEGNLRIETTTEGDVRDIPSSVFKTYVGRIEHSRILVGFKQFPDPDSEDCAEQNVGV
jgi:hypothetical protein